MSRVFLADDLALHRAVVIKVLHPELAAGVNAERFNREVLLSARLQHPHIVPVLTAGSVAGLPYYVMPFVKGESLRARIDAGPLSPAATAEILGDVAKALAYAHEEGVVHRDIKPDNILLSGGAATVADFGIAKALSSARRESADGALTTLGMSLGTPAYMAPEQVAGDPDTDHRADIYSLGCVAYEMLTGQPMFPGKSPQQLLAAQVMETPPNIATRRPDVPYALAATIMLCLEKEPSRRPQSALAIMTPLQSAGTISTTTTSSARRWLPWAIAAGVVIAVAIAVPLVRRDSTAVAGTGDALNLAVAPFEVLDPKLALWKEGIVDVLARNLDGAGPLRALSPSVTIKGWEGHAERNAAVAFAKKVGAQLVMYGQLQPAGRGLVSAKVWIVDAERGTPAVEVEVRDSIVRMDRVTDSLSVRALGAIGRMRTIGAARLASLGSSSLPAIRAFLQGAQYFRRTQFDSAASALREAVSLDSTFGIAYAMLGESYGWTDDGSGKQWEAFRKGGAQIRAGLSPHDSLTLVAIRHYAIANDKRGSSGEMKKAYAAAAAVTDRYPDDPAAWYLLADMRFHHDREISEREAFALFDRAIRADADFAPAYIHAIELAYRHGSAAGKRYADAYVSRSRASQQRDAIAFAERMAGGEFSGDKLRSVLDTIRPVIGGSALSVIRRLPDSAEVALEALRADARRNAGSGNQSARHRLIEALGFRGHIAEAWKLAKETPSYSAGEFALLGLVPADTAARVMRPWLQLRNDASLAVPPVLAMVRDTAGLNSIVRTATQMAKSDTSAILRKMLDYFANAARGYSALAAGDSAAATSIFDALPDSVNPAPAEQFVRARLVSRTDPRRALALLDRMSPMTDVLYPARQLERGRIAEKLGDAESAVDAYAFVAAAWRNTESGLLRNAVKEAKAALVRLDADGRMRATLSTGRR